MIPEELRSRALERLEAAVSVASQAELCVPEILAMLPQEPAGNAERRSLVLCALGSILFAYELGLLTQSERDAWIGRLPALPPEQTLVAARSRALAELREGIERLSIANRSCETLHPAWFLALGYLVQCGVLLLEDIEPLQYEANTAWSSPQEPGS